MRDPREEHPLKLRVLGGRWRPLEAFDVTSANGEVDDVNVEEPQAWMGERTEKEEEEEEDEFASCDETDDKDDANAESAGEESIESDASPSPAAGGEELEQTEVTGGADAQGGAA